MTREAQARAILDEWLDKEPRAMRKLPDPLQTLQPRIAAALAQARREVWEEAARVAESEKVSGDTHTEGDAGYNMACDHIAMKCHARASKEEGR